MTITSRRSTNSKAVTIPVSGSKQQVDEYVDMNGKSCQQAATDEYVDMNGKNYHQSDPHQEDSSMYIDIETAQDYEVPVGKKKTS